jgi:hypothetical protein
MAPAEWQSKPSRADSNRRPPTVVGALPLSYRSSHITRSGRDGTRSQLAAIPCRRVAGIASRDPQMTVRRRVEETQGLVSEAADVYEVSVDYLLGRSGNLTAT